MKSKKDGILMLLLKGGVIGVANVMPGVSGGTMAVILGIYDKLTESIGNFFLATKQKKLDYIKFLFILALGAVLGIGLFARVVEYSFINYPRLTGLFFSLLIIPSIPYILKGYSLKEKTNLISFLIGVVVIGIFIYLDYFVFDKQNEGLIVSDQINNLYLIKLFICGMLAAGAMIIPGISGSLLLLMLGEYYNILSFINHFISSVPHILTFGSIQNIIIKLNIIPLSIFGIGVIVGLIGVSKLINYLLQKYKAVTICFIAGIVVASIFQIWIGILK